MTTGAALPVNRRAADRIIAEMQRHERRFGVEPPEQERTTLIVCACVESGASRQVAYAKPGEAAALRYTAPRSAAPPPQPSKVGRNDPCPCGSGRKYKKCCGV